MPKTIRLRERILERMTIEDRGYITPCWVSNRYAQPNGYTRIGIIGKNPQFTHRVAYEEWCGPIPDGYQIDHLCRVRACCNPQHLEAVTPRVNTLRSQSPSGLAARKTHCHNGHPLSGENLYRRPDKPSHRGCRACRRQANEQRTRRQ